MMVKKILAFCFVICFAVASIKAQSDSTESLDRFSISSDLVSSYVWRGSSLVSSPCFQPSLSVSFGNFSIQAWGSNAFNGGWFETDLSVLYETESFKGGFTDYYTADDNGFGNYFNFQSSSTAHFTELSAEFKGNEKIPFRLMAASCLFGSDIDINGSRMYSSYLELGWLFTQGKTEAELKVGFTPAAGLYADGPAWVQAALRIDRAFAIGKEFKLPIFSEFVVNPYLGDVFLMFGLTIGN